MAIKLVVSNTVSFKVKGSLNDENGKPQPFDFKLTCKRLTQDEFNDEIRDREGSRLAEWLPSLIEGWSGVSDEDGRSLPFTDESLQQLLNIPGMPALVFAAYTLESSAKAKN